MTGSPRSSASRVLAIVMGLLAGLMGFLAFNVVDGIFGVNLATLGIAACIATTVFVFRRSPPEEGNTDV